VSAVDTRGALEAVERILNRGGDQEDVLRAVLDALHQRGVPYAAVRVGGEELSVGSPTAALTREALTVATDDEAFVERLATLTSAYVS
jgi:hypothetical protein